MSSFIAVRALRSAVNSGNLPWVRKCQLSTSSCGNTNNKSSGSTAGSSTSEDLAKNVPDPPSLVFYDKKIAETKFASKSGDYQNPEYFSYHQLSYVDMDVVMQKYRLAQPSSIAK